MRRTGGALVVVAALAGCHPRLPPPDLTTDPAALLAEVRAVQARVTTVQGRARVTVEGPGGSGGTDQWLAAGRPGRLHLEVFDFFGNVAAVLAVEEGRLALYDAREKVFLRGAATPANLARLVQVAVAPEVLVALLCGTAPLLDARPVTVEAGDGVLVLTLRAADLTQTLEIGAGAVVVASRTRRRLPGDGEVPVGLDVRFTDHHERAGVRWPSRASVEVPADRVVLALHWRDVEPGAPLDAALFRLAPPAGARVVDLDAPAP